MKFYLLPFLFFIFLFGWTGSSCAQEHLQTESSPVPTQQDHQIQTNEHPASAGRLYSEHHDIPDVLTDRVEHESDTFQAKFLNMLFLLALLIGFMILASWALKRLMKTKINQLNTTNNIKILETRYLSPRATLYLVEIVDQTFLIAESPTTVTYLAALPKESDNTVKNT